MYKKMNNKKQDNVGNTINLIVVLSYKYIYTIKSHKNKIRFEFLFHVYIT